MSLSLRFLIVWAAIAINHPAFAAKRCCWIDVKTGKTVGSVPFVPTGGKGGNHAELSLDGKTAFNPTTGQNFARDQDGCWIDVKTGKRVGSVPFVPTSGKGGNYAELSLDGKTAFNPTTGQNFALEECPRTTRAPPPTRTPSTTDKVTDVLKTIGNHVSIGIGGGTGTHGGEHHDRVRGEDRTRTAEKLSDHKTHTTTTPKSSKGKTVTSACKCHPCTCSPCTCH
jgi:hypothetical protein